MGEKLSDALNGGLFGIVGQVSWMARKEDGS